MKKLSSTVRVYEVVFGTSAAPDIKRFRGDKDGAAAAAAFAATTTFNGRPTPVNTSRFARVVAERRGLA